MREKDYFLGFDIGTGSVGWAVTDTKYNLLKINRKKAWGSVLFDTSEGAGARRFNRCTRRRIRRQKERLNLLRELFEEEIYKVDAGFFHRLSESRYLPEDKIDYKGLKPELPYALFADERYTDIDYYRDFPTIYHLRKALIEGEKEYDIRLVYLAIAHIMKHRGHFLANVGSDDTNLDFYEIINDLFASWNELSEDETRISLSEEQIELVKNVLMDNGLSKTSKKQKVIAVCNNASKQIKELVALITGGTVTLSKLFDVKEFDGLENNKICFDESSYEEKEEYFAENLADRFDIIAKAKVVYDWMILLNILKGNDSGLISVAKVNDYEKHEKDLKVLKLAIRNDIDATEEEKNKIYKLTFGIPKKDINNYSVYVGFYVVNGKKTTIKSCGKVELYKYINKYIVPKLKEGDNKKYIVEHMELGSFLPKLRVAENSVIPYQLHLKELKIILDNAEKYLSFLSLKDDNGLSVSDKIISLMKFKIPYYVGPLNASHKNAWVIRKENGKVTPWNFSDKIDVDRSAAEFIERMTSRCTYLKNEKVLSKSSLLYEKYLVLNELNNLKIKSEPISVDLKQRIYINVFEKKSKVTIKKIIEYLKREELGYSEITKEDISGYDVEIKSSLRSYHAFKSAFTGIDLSENVKEDIVKDMTLFGAEPELLMKRLKAKYPEYEKKLLALTKSLKCNEWGRLSYKLLSGIAVDIEGQGQVGTIIYQMWNTNSNFMQVLNDRKYNYLKLIEDENGVLEKKDIRYELVENLYVSPSVKRQIWKAVQVLDEITCAMGHAPKRIFVEMAREHMESKRSVTRKDTLLSLYKSLKNDEIYNQLKKEDNDSLRKDKLYLYYLQEGYCAYSGVKIDIEKLSDDNIYDIDHIYPQSATADDSLDNRVLVCKEINENEKKDIYPIDKDIQAKMIQKWYTWKHKGLISDEKYKRLTRTTELTTDELVGFVNRQLVETRQSTKEFMNVLKDILPADTELVYSKAKNVSVFRQTFDIIKVRELNDLHHAKDAYLNIVVGNVFHLKFTKDINKYFAKYGTYRTYNLKKMYKYDVKYKDETAWVAGANGTISIVKNTLNSDKILVSRAVYTKKGELFDVNPVKKGKGQLALKSNHNDSRLSDIEKYGGYNSAKISYFSLVEGINKKGKLQRYITSVPLHLSKKIEENSEFAKKYYESECKLTNINIIKNKLHIQTLLVCEGFKMRITGKSDARIVLNNDNQLCLCYKYQKLLKEVIKFNKDRLEKTDSLINEKSGITNELLIELYDEFVSKLDSTIYREMFDGYRKILIEGRDRFIALSLENKTLIIYQILKLFQCNAEMPNLFEIGGAKTPARIRINMNITGRKNLAIIHQSVTGLYEQIERIGI